MKEEEIIRESIEQFLRHELNPDQAEEVSIKIREQEIWQKIHQNILSESQGIRFNHLLKLKSKLNDLESTHVNIINLSESEGYLKHFNASNVEANENYKLEERSDEIKHHTNPDPSTVQGIRYSTLQSKLSKLKEQEKNWIEVQSKEPKPIKIIFIKKYWWAAAASLFFIFSVYFLINQKPQYSNSYLLEHFDDYLLHDKSRSTNGQEKLDKDKEIGYDLYVLKEFKEAIPYLIRRWENQNDSIALFYLAVSYAGIGEFDKSEQLIRQLNNFSDKEIILNKLIK